MPRIMECLFDLKMIAEFSWSGVQKSKTAVKKLSFKSNKNIVALINEVLTKADSSWSDVKNDAKLQTHLKHPKFYRQKTKKDADADAQSERNSDHTLTMDASGDSRGSIPPTSDTQISGQNIEPNQEQDS